MMLPFDHPVAAFAVVTAGEGVRLTYVCVDRAAAEALAARHAQQFHEPARVVPVEITIRPLSVRPPGA